MSNLKLIVTVSILAVISFAFLLSWQFRSLIYETFYDLLNENKEISTKTEVDKFLRSLEYIGFNDLESEYLDDTNIGDPAYLMIHKNIKFYKISPKDIYKRVVGKIKLKDLLAKDNYYQSAIMDRSKSIYWVIDKRILYKIIELRDEIRSQGFLENGFVIEHGYRTPSYNTQVGGASKSRHINGEAVDLIINDINGDGKYTFDDKKIVIDILENKVIKNTGGIGLYPGTRVVHMDVRGYRARWDSY